MSGLWYWRVCKYTWVVAWVLYSNDDVYLESFVSKHVNKHVKSLNMRCLIN